MIILSPGPVTTSDATKAAMLRDFSPNEPELLALTAGLRRSLVEIANGGAGLYLRHAAGCGQHAPTRRCSGRWCRAIGRFWWSTTATMARACWRSRGRSACRAQHSSCRSPSRWPPEQVDAALAADALDQPSRGLPCRHRHRAAQSDRAAGRGRPQAQGRADRRCDRLVRRPADRCARRSARRRSCCRANKWLEGVPGMALVLVRRAALEAAAGRCHSFCLDLHRQWRSHETHGGWRFTPPAQAIAALTEALRQHAEEGSRGATCAGCAATGARWWTACARWASRPCCATRWRPR